ncbi:MAG: PilZ domain-containing protein [Desulfobacterales bacterium]|nr:MAG: PilZ domain-containing protein [Desulfobacterales bacterium]
MKRNDYKSDVQNRILQIISTFSEPQMEQLLHALKKWEQPLPIDKHEPKFSEKRVYLRKNASIYGIFETKKSNFRDFTKNVSAGGILIEPETTLSFHEDLFITFFHSSFNYPVRTNGKVVRVDPDGVGVKFYQAIPTMSSV